MGTLHLVTSPDALAAALAACGNDDEVALVHRAARGVAPAGAHVLAGDDASRRLLELVLRHERSVTWR